MPAFLALRKPKFLHYHFEFFWRLCGNSLVVFLLALVRKEAAHLSVAVLRKVAVVPPVNVTLLCAVKSAQHKIFLTLKSSFYFILIISGPKKIIARSHFDGILIINIDYSKWQPGF